VGPNKTDSKKSPNSVKNAEVTQPSGEISVIELKMKEFFVAEPATLLQSDAQVTRKKSSVKEIE